MRKESFGMAVFMVVMSALFSLAMFHGLEYHIGYCGNAYQALHPESFAGDPFMPPHRPTMLSLYYLLVKWVGPIWLDDRFTICLFMGLTIISLIGLDKTIRLFGAGRFQERIALLSFMLLEHRFQSTHAIFMDTYEFNPTTLACPAIIWLFYHSLAGSSLPVVFSLMVLAVLISVKNAWLPVMLCCALLCKDRLDGQWNKRVGITALALCAVILGWYYLFLRPGSSIQAPLFDYILKSIDGSEGNPFLDPWIGNLLFALLCIAGFWVKAIPALIQSRVRLIAEIGLAVWFFGGLYFSCAPDALKIPYLIPFDVTRAIWWPQYILFIAIGVALVKWLQRAASWREVGTAWGILLGLYLLHMELRGKLLAVVLSLTVVMLWFSRWDWRTKLLSPEMRLRIVAVTLCVGTASLYGIGAVHRRWAALKYLVRYGVVGDNPGAKWVGVDAYIRRATPPTATVLALSTVGRDSFSGKEMPMRADAALRTRGGRSMPIGSQASLYFDYPRLKWTDDVGQHLVNLGQAWERHDLNDVIKNLSALGSPDYLVVPQRKAQWLAPPLLFPYVRETTVGDFDIFRKNS